MKEDEVGGTCSTHGGGERYARFWLGDPKGRDHWEDIGIGARIALS
jgi:hypothetical protein